MIDVDVLYAQWVMNMRFPPSLSLSLHINLLFFLPNSGIVVCVCVCVCTYACKCASMFWITDILTDVLLYHWFFWYFLKYFKCVPHFSAIVKHFELPKALYNKFSLQLLLLLYFTFYVFTSLCRCLNHYFNRPFLLINLASFAEEEGESKYCSA